MTYYAEYWDDVQTVMPFCIGAESLAGSTVLLTGATGLIGSAVMDVLHSLNVHRKFGIHVIAAGRSKERLFARFPYFSDEAGWESVFFDASGSTSLGVHADYVIHCASNANPALFATRPIETMKSNFMGLDALLETAVASCARRFLFVSSSEVYGIGDSQSPASEDDYGFLDILNPRSCYPSAKRAGETLCVSYAAEYGLQCVIARPGHVYGPGITESDNRATAQFTRTACKGEPIILKSAGTQIRSYVYSLDCASAILTMLCSDAQNTAYNISNPRSVLTIAQIAQLFASSGNVPIVHVEQTDMERKSGNLMYNSSVDSSRLLSLGWNAVFCAPDGVSRTLRFF